MAVTYLELVNNAIIESGTDLDVLTSGSFASTTDSMQGKFKRWTAQAWKDIQTERRHWHFMRKDGVYIAKPRLMFYDGTGAANDVFDNATITDANDNWIQTINGALVVEAGSFAATTGKGYFAYKNEDDTYPITEEVKVTDLVNLPLYTFTFDEYTANPTAFPGPFVEGASLSYVGDIAYPAFGTVVSADDAVIGEYTVTFTLLPGAVLQDVIDVLSAQSNHTLNVGEDGSFLYDFIGSEEEGTQSLRILGHGRYSLGEQSDTADSLLTDIQEVDVRSFKISPYIGAADQDYSTTGYTKLEFVPYEKWKQMGWDKARKGLGAPCYFTIASDGRYEFNTALDKEYAISFTYWKTPQVLSAHGDVVEGIADYYTEAIVWKTLQYWADYDEQQGEANRAMKRFSAVYRKMLRDYADEIKFPYGVGDASVLG